MAGARAKQDIDSAVQVVDLGEGKALLNVNQVVPLRIALKVRERLQRRQSDEDQDAGRGNAEGRAQDLR